MSTEMSKVNALKELQSAGGEELSAEDIVHYPKIVVELKETVSLIREIDEVIDVHGGWPLK